MAGNQKVIETFDISKVFELKGKGRTVRALNNVNISINENEIFGLLGPNGAGKTTLIQILTTLMHPTSGYATLYGRDIVKNPKDAKSKIALMLGRSMLYFRITAYDNLKFFCKVYKVPSDRERIYNAAKEFGIEDWLNQYVEKFSSGMKMRLALCRTLLLNRPILFLDEPTLGLDVSLKNYVIDKIKKLNKTVLFTSHDMGVVEKICDRIAFINKGNIVKIGTKDDISEFMEKEIKVEVKLKQNKQDLSRDLSNQDFVVDVADKNAGLIVTIKERYDLNELLLVLGKYKIYHLKMLEQSLEDLFIKLTSN